MYRESSNKGNNDSYNINYNNNSQLSQSISYTPSEESCQSNFNTIPYTSPNKKRSRQINYSEEFDLNSSYNSLPPIHNNHSNNSNSNGNNNTSNNNQQYQYHNKQQQQQQIGSNFQHLFYSQESNKPYSQDVVTNRLDNLNCSDDCELKSNFNKTFHDLPPPAQLPHHNQSQNYHYSNGTNSNKTHKVTETQTMIHSVINHFLPVPPLKSSKTTIWLSSNQEKPRFRWDFVDVGELGHGAHSSVYVARHRLDGSLYAIKKLHASINDTQPSFSDVKEVCANIALKGCPNLVQYFGSWIEDDHLWIQLELCLRVNLDVFVTADSVPIPTLSRPTSSSMSLPSFYDDDDDNNNNNNTDNKSYYQKEDQETLGKNEFKSTPQKQQQLLLLQLQQHIQKEPLLSETAFWKILNSISKALEFIHSKSLAHLDIRPANIFIASTSIPEITNGTTPKRTISLPPSCFGTPRLKGPSRQPSITRNTSFKTMQSFTSVTNCSTTFPPPGRLEKKNSDCESVSCGMTQKSEFNDEIYFASSQSLIHGDMSFQGSLVEELPPLEMSQPESIFEENRFKSYDNIKAEEVNENISNGNWDIKLGDLGLCCRIDDYSFNEGEDRYCAVELIQRTTNTLDLTKADIFSLGASLLEMCLGRKLCSSGEEWRSLRDGRFQVILESYEKDKSNIPYVENQPSFIELMNYSQEIRNILKQMLHCDPSYRPNATILKVLSASNLKISSILEEERNNYQTILSLNDKIRELENNNELLKSQLNQLKNSNY